MARQEARVSKWSQVALLGALAFNLAACGGDETTAFGVRSESSGPPAMSFDAFMAGVHQPPGAEGRFIYDGDTPALSVDELREVHARMGMARQGLAVNRVSGLDDKWNATQKLNLRYCVSNNFGANKSQVISALAVAAAMWRRHAQVEFIYTPSQDATCTASNTNVVFDVRPATLTPTLATAFFPSYPRSRRNLLIDPTAFSYVWPLEILLLHELGHVLGFRHEHTRPGGAAACFEDNDWRALTLYDPYSVMHYPNCGGANPVPTGLSTLDIQGAASLYGPWRGPPVPPSGCGRLGPGRGIAIGSGLASCDGRFLLTLQTGGNLVLYHGALALWSANTFGLLATEATLQLDGVFGLYTEAGAIVWSPGTGSNPGASLRVQDDGDVVLVSATGTPLWSTRTGGH